MWRAVTAAVALWLVHVATAFGAGATLVYQVEQAENSATAHQPPIALVVAVVQERLHELKIGHVEVTARRWDQLAVELASGDAKSIARVEESLAHSGHLEFRILADKRDAARCRRDQAGRVARQQGARGSSRRGWQNRGRVGACSGQRRGR